MEINNVITCQYISSIHSTFTNSNLFLISVKKIEVHGEKEAVKKLFSIS